MANNKSQGQSIKYIGINFRIPVFTHGQFYVAMSRCTSGNRVKVLFRDSSTDTITKIMVCPEALLNINHTHCKYTLLSTKYLILIICIYCRYIVKYIPNK